jgi:hypothetical protein
VFDQFSMLSGKETVTRDDFHNFKVSFWCHHSLINN